MIRWWDNGRKRVLFKKAAWGTHVAFFLFASFVFSTSTRAQSTNLPQNFTVEGRIFFDGVPATDPVDLIFEIYDDSNSLCILYRETHTNVSVVSAIPGNINSNGMFARQLGSVPQDPLIPNTLNDVFKNGSAISGITNVGTGCNLNPVNGVIGDRLLRIKVKKSADLVGSEETLAPDTLISAVPRALIADTLRGKVETDFVQITSDVTQAKADNIFGSLYSTLTNPALPNIVGGSSSLYMQTNGNGAVIPSFGSDPPMPAEGQMWFNTSDSTIKYFAGGSVQSVGASSSDPTKLPLDGSASMSGNLDLDGNDLLATGHVSMSPLSTITIGKYTTVQQGTLVGSMTIANKGATWFNSNTNKLMFWDGAAAKVVNDMIVGSAAGELFTVDQVPSCPASQKLQMSAGPMYTWSCVSEPAPALIEDADGDSKIQVEAMADEDKIHFQTGGTERMLIGSDGNVGIGTATPAQKLDVDGRVKADEYCIGASCIAAWPLTSALTSVAAGTGIVVTNSTGPAAQVSVDIGSTAGKLFTIDQVPVCLAHQKLQMVNSSGTFTWQCTNVKNMADGDNNTRIQLEENTNEDVIRFDTNGLERMIIDKDGKVGVGGSPISASSPIFHVSPSLGGSAALSAQFEGPVKIRNNSTGQPSNIILTNLNGSDTGTALEFRGHTSGTERNAARIVGSQSSGNGSLSFETAVTNTFTEKMRILSNGNVGIGFSNPSMPLDVNGSVQAVNGTFVSRGTGNGFVFYDRTNTSHLWTWSSNAGTATFHNSVTNAAALTVDSAGNVGIDAVNPGLAKLDVQGEIRTTDHNGLNRLWGRGRPNVDRYGTAGPEAPLCSHGGAAGVEYGLSRINVNWAEAEQACPRGTWVCTEFELMGATMCNTARPDDGCDGYSDTGACVDVASNVHLGWLSDAPVSTSTRFGRARVEGGTTAFDHPSNWSLPVWCCSKP